MSHTGKTKQPSGVVQWPDADEIMQMAFEEGQPSEDASGYYFELEEFDLFIQRLMEEVARLNSSPVSAGDDAERAGLDSSVIEEVIEHMDHVWSGEADEDVTVELTRRLRDFARAALSAPIHGEQVREAVPDEMRSLAQRLREYNLNPHHINPMSEAFHVLVAEAANALSAACAPKEIIAAITWADHLLFECGALTRTRAPSVHVYNKTFEAVNAAKAMLAAAPSAGSQKEQGE